MTKKYSAAIRTAHNHRLPADETRHQVELYGLLQDHGYFWDSVAGEWVHLPPEEALDPTPLVMIRVWAAADAVELAADEVVERLRVNFNLVERSGPYPCRPPKQFESRIYLKFLPR
jgi:hypothetical protein